MSVVLFLQFACVDLLGKLRFPHLLHLFPDSWHPCQYCWHLLPLHLPCGCSVSKLVFFLAFAVWDLSFFESGTSIPHTFIPGSLTVQFACLPSLCWGSTVLAPLVWSNSCLFLFVDAILLRVLCSLFFPFLQFFNDQVGHRYSLEFSLFDHPPSFHAKTFLIILWVFGWVWAYSRPSATGYSVGLLSVLDDFKLHLTMFPTVQALSYHYHSGGLLIGYPIPIQQCIQPNWTGII